MNFSKIVDAKKQPFQAHLLVSLTSHYYFTKFGKASVGLFLKSVVSSQATTRQNNSTGAFPFEVKMETKKCFKCGVEKSLNDFYKHPAMYDGHVNKCKECNKKDVQQNYRDNRDYYIAYDRNRANLPHRVEARKIYQQTHPDIVRRLKEEWAKRNPDKRKAQIKVGNAVRDGKLARQPCEVCGSEKAQAHHDDYSKPLDVRWLCSKHHAEHHKNERRQKKC